MMTKAELAFSALDRDNKGFISQKDFRKLTKKLSDQELNDLMEKVGIRCRCQQPTGFLQRSLLKTFILKFDLTFPPRFRHPEWKLEHLFYPDDRKILNLNLKRPVKTGFSYFNIKLEKRLENEFKFSMTLKKILSVSVRFQ